MSLERKREIELKDESKLVKTEIELNTMSEFERESELQKKRVIH